MNKVNGEYEKGKKGVNLQARRSIYTFSIIKTILMHNPTSASSMRSPSSIVN